MKKILLASVLKPIDDTRIYEKFARSLASQFEVHVLGYEAKPPSYTKPNSYFHPLYHFRGKQKRTQANRVLIALVKRLQPDWLIVHTPELLPAALYCKWRYGTKLAYDIMENYAQNFLHQPIYPLLARWPMAFAVRCIEWFSTPWLHYCFLAEKNYASELGFLRHCAHEVLENKCVPLVPIQDKVFPRKLNKGRWHLIYMGTISEVYGIKDVLNWCIHLAEYQTITLTIAGYTRQKKLSSWLREQAQKHDWLQLIGIEELVSHTTILSLINQADLALLPYQPNRSTERCIPTKLYECMAYGLPMLMPPNSLWENIAGPHQAAYTVDFQQPPSHSLIEGLQKTAFYPLGPDTQALWEEEGKRLVEALLVS